MVGLVDEWAARFFEELDYVNEGENGTLFAEMMKKDLPQVTDIIIYQHSFHFSSSAQPTSHIRTQQEEIRN